MNKAEAIEAVNAQMDALMAQQHRIGATAEKIERFTAERTTIVGMVEAAADDAFAAIDTAAHSLPQLAKLILTAATA